ncbi:hypothetical protein AALP_AA8G430800 [Arabis alpina]|uniref:Reverse transcriptase domain-containing protein n=1 Tax=Arabis alpina TaxID=50452 RepID=A0A087GD46_ARAAL|nr:hypothetical protein AALP_AA8G430800 [Arabis alpina]
MSLTLKLLLLLLVFSHHADSGSIVKFLPGFEGPLPFELETGYIGVGEEEELQLFYYFIKSENNPQEDPLLIWMTGGPGCSSVNGFLYEIGPLTIKIEAYDGNIPSLVPTTYSWTKLANILFLDQPVGSGFSYKRTPITDKSSDTLEVVRVHEFLRKWLDKHPEFFSNPFYVAGDSYSGKIVPALVQKISEENYRCCKPPINLQGYVLGNPVTNIVEELNNRIPYAHGMALISDELYEAMKKICKGNYVFGASRNTECLKLIEKFHKCTDNIHVYNILLSYCDMTSPDCLTYKFLLLSYWANDKRVQDALQVNKGSIEEWVRCSGTILYNKNMNSSLPYHINNSNQGYRSLIYNKLIRLARNRILAIEDEDGLIQRGDVAIGNTATTYFTKLFQSTRQPTEDYVQVFDGFQKRVTDEMNTELTRPVTEDEVRHAIFDIGPDRAPGPDGITGAFYQQFWPDIKEEILSEITLIFQRGAFQGPTNHTNICLIPKPDVPKSMSDFRPIALCNVSYKIISKILVGRLKKVLPGIISNTQAAFIPGRHIMDNVIIAHEMLHSLKRRKRWAKSYMTVKTDISKAYDRMEWQFIKDTMMQMGFNDTWIGWIMMCVETVTFSTLVNGVPTGTIIPHRGIRQGDPLSPYIFILCAEVLSHLFTRAAASKQLKGMKISHTGPTVNHLLFADDALFFCHAHQLSCTTILRLLSEYERVSGQAINLSKSAITFGAKVRDDIKSRLRHILNIHNDGGCGKYLGLPESIGRKKKEIFQSVLDKVKQRTRSWSHRYLSEAGREVLLKTVALALPVYTMNCFKLPKGTCAELNTIIANDWWSKGSDKRSVHWFSWKRMGLPKKEGGLGFRDIENFNLALLGKQVHRLFTNPSSLVAQLLKGRYFPATNIMEAGNGSKPSYIWRSLLDGRELVKKGLRCLVGDGANIRAFQDNWLDTHPPRSPRPISDIPTNIQLVKDLMLRGTNRWNMELLSQTIHAADVQEILKLPVSSSQLHDLIGWNYTKDGMYTVRSGYWLSTHLPDQIPIPPPSRNQHINEAIWKLQTAPKLRHFCWRIISQAMPIGSILQRRGIAQSIQCRRCGDADETPDHLFFGCEYAKQIWEDVGMAWVIRDSHGFYKEAGSGIGTSCTTVLEAELQALLMAVIYAWSKGYERIIFEGDNITVYNLVTGEDLQFGLFNRLSEIRHWLNKFREADIRWVHRESNKFAGYTRTYANKMTFATVKGGGHTAEYKPNESFIMFQRWISGQPL